MKKGTKLRDGQKGTVFVFFWRFFVLCPIPCFPHGRNRLNGRGGSPLYLGCACMRWKTTWCVTRNLEKVERDLSGNELEIPSSQVIWSSREDLR